jgi:hypothetical protein
MHTHTHVYTHTYNVSKRCLQYGKCTAIMECECHFGHSLDAHLFHYLRMLWIMQERKQHASKAHEYTKSLFFTRHMLTRAKMERMFL